MKPQQTDLFATLDAARRRAGKAIALPQEPPRARNTDPDTAHAAAAAIELKVVGLQLTCLEALRAAGARGLTSREISEATGIEHSTVSPRLRPLERKGLIIETDARRRCAKGREARVWRVV